jgi:hypothetical protein
MNIAALPGFRILLIITLIAQGVRSNSQNVISSMDATLDDVESFPGGEFAAVCQAHNKPCGIEKNSCVSESSKNARSPIHIRKTSLKNALNQATTLLPGHRWIVRDGVINLEPVMRRGPDLLSRRLDKVSLHGVSSEDAFYLVFKQAGIRTGGSAYVGGGPIFGSIDLDLSDITVRDAMNAITKADGQIVWQYCPDKPEQSLVSFNVSSWRKPPVPGKKLMEKNK